MATLSLLLLFPVLVSLEWRHIRRLMHVLRQILQMRQLQNRVFAAYSANSADSDEQGSEYRQFGLVVQYRHKQYVTDRKQNVKHLVVHLFRF